MPAIATGRSVHFEGSNIRTLARIVGLDQVMLTPEDAGLLTIHIERFGRRIYEKAYSAIDQNGILDAPAKPSEWTLRGLCNFDFTHDAETLEVSSPPFAFEGGNTYTIVYDWDTELHGHVLAYHVVEIR